MLYTARQQIQDSFATQIRCYILSLGFLFFSGCSIQKDIREDTDKIQEDIHTISENIDGIEKNSERMADSLEHLVQIVLSSLQADSDDLATADDFIEEDDNPEETLFRKEIPDSSRDGDEQK